MNIANILYVALWSLALREELLLVGKLAHSWASTSRHLLDNLVKDSEWP